MAEENSGQGPIHTAFRKAVHVVKNNQAAVGAVAGFAVAGPVGLVAGGLAGYVNQSAQKELAEKKEAKPESKKK